ncbi:ABC transporter permease subunit [Rhizobium sp. Root1212]|uniref:ABC transporter permease subunit n=1 Tax=unclassified Rhizobium TaxID=2613769 RepID=UPI00329988D9
MSISRRWRAISNAWRIPAARASPTRCCSRSSPSRSISYWRWFPRSYRPCKTIDNIISVITLVLLSLPDFLVATILLFVFAVAVPVLPALANISENSSWQEMLRATVLPAVKLANMMAVYAIRVLRDSLIEVLRSDYVRLAELKGLGPAPRFSATRFPMPSCRR